MRLFKWIFLVAILGLWGVEPIWAEGKKKKPSRKRPLRRKDEEEKEDEEDEEDEDKDPKFAKVIKDFDKVEGLFDLYRDPEENKVFLAIRPDQFDQIYLCSITRTQGDGYFFDSASLVSIGRGWGTFPFVFQRVGKKVFFAHKNVYYRAEPDAAIHRAVDRGLSDSILGVGSIEGQPHPETGAVLVDPNDFFVQDIALVSSFFSEYLKKGSYSFDSDNSYFGALKNFPHNTEIDVVLHFATDSPQRDIPTLADTRSFQHIYHYSLSSLPESDFRPRLADDRVGHFTTLHQDYTSVLKDDPYVRYINRWHLEKAEPKFDQSPPKKPIVFWLENTIPPEYRDAVQEGILVWNKAFEPLGFEGAIVAKQQPDDAEWDAADVRYNVGALDGAARPGVRGGAVAHQSLYRRDFRRRYPHQRGLYPLRPFGVHRTGRSCGTEGLGLSENSPRLRAPQLWGTAGDSATWPTGCGRRPLSGGTCWKLAPRPAEARWTKKSSSAS